MTGIHVKFKGDVDYYAAQNESARRPLPKIDGANRRTFKTEGKSVTVKNRLFEFEIFEDGTFKVTPHSQVKERIEDIQNA